MARRGTTLLKANDDYDSPTGVKSKTQDDDEGYDVDIAHNTARENKAESTIDAQIAQLAKGQADLAEAMGAMAQILNRGYGEELELADDDEEDEDYDEDKSDAKSDKARRGGMDRLRSSRAKISKDDTATSFGEIDVDTPGNRPHDQTRHDESDTVITGRGTGPGPSGGTLRKAITADVTEAVADMLRKANLLPTSAIAKSSQTPEPDATSSQAYTASTINKAIDETSGLVQQYAQMSWIELNRARAELDPTGLQPFPIFGQPYGGEAYISSLSIR